MVAAARRISHVLLLALVAFVLAVGLDPAVQWLGRLRIRRGWAVAIIFVGLVVFLALFVALLIPLLAREVPQFAGALPGYVADLQRRDDWLGNAFRHANVSAEVRQFIADLPGKIGESFTAIVGAAGTAFGRVFDVFTVGILCIYFMVALPRLPATIAKLVSRDRRAHVDMLLQRSFDKIGGYVSGNLITSAVCAAATVVALLALRVDYAVPLGLWAGVADLIPQVGAYLGALPAVLVALTEGPRLRRRDRPVLHRLPTVRELHPGPAGVQELDRPLTGGRHPQHPRRRDPGRLRRRPARPPDRRHHQSHRRRRRPRQPIQPTTRGPHHDRPSDAEQQLSASFNTRKRTADAGGVRRLGIGSAGSWTTSVLHWSVDDLVERAEFRRRLAERLRLDAADAESRR